MLGATDKKKTSGELLRQILITHLWTGRAVDWPGADGLTDDDIINCYPRAIAAGQVPGWHELEKRFPELTGEVQALRSGKEWLNSPVSHDCGETSSPRSCESSPAHSEGAVAIQAKENEPKQEADADHLRLARWLVSFASHSGWYPVGEFIALDAAAAIERAVAVFGPGAAHQAEQIPWDAAPLSKVNM